MNDETKTSSKTFIESREEMESFLRENNVGYLGLSLGATPYVVPLNYGYTDGKILFHCALSGRKLDYLRANPRVCFTVARQSGKLCRHPQGASCPIDTDSVICFGVARTVEDLAERRDVLNAFNRCLQPAAEEITLEAASKCYAVEIEITEMTARRQRFLEHTYWKYRFDE